MEGKMVSIGSNITFRRLEEKDLRLMHKWLNTDFVIEWYDKGGSSFSKIMSKYMPRVKGEEAIYSFIIVCNNKDIGYIQTCLIEDYPEYNQCVNIKESAAGIDLFIGEQDFVHKGLGKQILIKFLSEYVFQLYDVECCIIGPEPKNNIAIRAYEKAGFKYFKTIQVPDEDEPEYLMRIYKNEVNSIINSQGGLR